VDPVDDLFVRRLASGDALHQARVNFDIRRPLQPVGVEEARGEQERRALVGLGGSGWFLGEVL